MNSLLAHTHRPRRYSLIFFLSLDRMMQRSDIEQAYPVTDEEKDEIRSDRPLLRDNEKVIDLERQLPRTKEEQNEKGYGTTAYLGLYFMMNLSLTFYNKLVLGKVSLSRMRRQGWNRADEKSSLRFPGSSPPYTPGRRRWGVRSCC